MLSQIYLMENRLKKKQRNSEEKCITHYKSSHKILLVGEGNFSFAACLARAFGNASNIFATSLDSQDELVGKYADAKANLEVLEEKDCIVLHRVNAHTLSEHYVLKYHRFDRIVFNFPHDNQFLVRREHTIFQIGRYQNLVSSFFESACSLLSYEGEIHVTHKTSHPFDRWKITELAEEAGLEMVDQVGFSKWDYPGYRNKKGEAHGSRCDWTFPVGASSTFMFRAL